MRKRHFEAFDPVCPRCLRDGKGEHSLVIQAVSRESTDSIDEGILGCPAIDCRLEFPIIDGVPVLHPDPRAFLSENANQLLMRRDISDPVSSLLGDALGPGSVFDTNRQYLSTYAWDHYAEFDPQESASTVEPGGATRILKAALQLQDDAPAGPTLDLGCSTGRTSFDLADRSDELVLGLDMNFAMLQIAQEALTEGRVSYPRRRVGVVYDQRRFPVEFRASENVDFWLCDCLAPPIRDGVFGLISAMNLIDCVYDPPALLLTINRLLREGGSAALVTPFDWSPSATPVEAWIGGHSQRGDDAGASEIRMGLLLEGLSAGVPGFRLAVTGELDAVPWHARLHDRSTVIYTAFVQLLRKAGAAV